MDWFGMRTVWDKIGWMAVGKLIIGTCGYSYPEWKGVFYPEKAARKDFLAFYSGEFRAVELNATFYQIPALKTLEGMVARTPAGFTFVVKAHQALTHVREDAGAVLPAFREALKPFSDGGKLGGVLMQFPYSFRPSAGSIGHVEKTAEALAGAPVIVEFRNSLWFKEETYSWLGKTGLSICCVDEPALTGLPPRFHGTTGPVGYVRFHGRNADAWWGKNPPPGEGEYIGHGKTGGGDPSARYRYLYKEDELREWVPRVEKMAEGGRIVYAMFNNHPDGYAVRNARGFARMTGGDNSLEGRVIS